MRKLKIAQLVGLTEKVPPLKYGGVELVAYNIIEELIRRGHQVTLFASGDSKTKAKLVSVCPKALRGKSSSKLAYNLLLLEKLIKKEKEFDIIHNHAGWLLFPFAKYFKRAKLVTTLHGRLNTKQSQLILGHFRKLNYVSISYSQRRHLPNLNYLANVYNGIDIKAFEFDARPKDYLVFLGRISPEKGIEKAIKIAKLAKKKLKIAAKIDPVDQEYWKKKVKPKIDGKQIVYVGEVGHTRKVQLLKNAQALINPISWEEPFGLVMIEAMACGTPVIAPKRASVPEIVIDKETGFIVDPKNLIKSSVKAIGKINLIDRRKCQRHVANKFTIEKMVDGYEKVYQKILTR